MAYLQARGLAETHVADFQGRRGPQGHLRTHPTPLPEDAYCDNWIAANGLRFLEGFPAGQPWHLVVNFTGPHSPMDVTDAMRERWEGVRFPASRRPARGWTRRRWRPTTPCARTTPRCWRTSIAQMGRFLDLVRQRGELERTIVVYSSDHGEMLGDHGRWGKSVAYQPSVGVPLVVAGPGVQRRRGERRPGLDARPHRHLPRRRRPAPAAGHGQPLARALCSPAPRSATGPTCAPGWATGGWSSTAGTSWCARRPGRRRHADGAPSMRLFDLQDDPWETRDLAARRPEEVARLAPLLAPGT